MKRMKKILVTMLCLLLNIAILCPSAFARDFAPVIDATNLGVNTQYKYEENDPSWLRQLVIKEDMLSTNGLMSEEILHPVTSYPYTTDAPHFKAQVEDYIEMYTLDEDSQRAAYLYLLEQIGALNVISDPDVSDKTKAEWLRNHGIIVTEEDENDPEKLLMISALYALMKNDFYYVLTGKELTIPQGTALEEAVVMYLMALSGNDSELTEFLLRFFGNATIGNLDDYIYYTSLMTLYTQGYVSPKEIPTIQRNEVYRRVAIMTIRNAGIAIDSETATTEEIRHKYLAAMLGTQYSVTVDPAALKKALNNGTTPYYILQRMAYEDANLTISQSKYTYEECFKLVLQKTDRFDLKNEFYSDVYEYDVHLDNIRSNISVNPNPISKTGTTISINGVDVANAAYALVELTGKAKETITIVSRHVTGKDVETTVYKVNVYQGTTAPPDSNLTGIIPTLGSGIIDNAGNGSNGNLQGPDLNNAMNNINSAASPVLNSVLTLNEKGQLVDQYGNIVSDSTYETLPDGYSYVLNDDGIVSVVFTNKNGAESTTADGSDTFGKEDIPKIIAIVSAVCILLLLIGIAIVLLISKKKGKMTEAEKIRARKFKERRKKEKRENRQNRNNT
ncbi:MAG: hypothetical protein ACI4VW_06215 [Acutalibacteraceae bacterium]